jgi:apolipoprotein N-acyltransferase
LAVLATAAPPGGYLLTGAARSLGRNEDGVWNSLLVIGSNGRVEASYDKVHLVPLGEYIPFHRQLAPVSGMIGRGSFEEGKGPATLALPGLPPVAPMICYEVIFPGAIVDRASRPRWLVNITNDSWFGVSTGPYQHLTSARLRAVEEGLPMIRSANTGISAVIDAYGRVLASLDMERQGVIDHALPPERAATMYSRWGDWMLMLLLASMGILLVVKAPKYSSR